MRSAIKRKEKKKKKKGGSGHKRNQIIAWIPFPISLSYLDQNCFLKVNEWKKTTAMSGKCNNQISLDFSGLELWIPPLALKWIQRANRNNLLAIFYIKKYPHP